MFGSDALYLIPKALAPVEIFGLGKYRSGLGIGGRTGLASLRFGRIAHLLSLPQLTRFAKANPVIRRIFAKNILRCVRVIATVSPANPTHCFRAWHPVLCF